ncbi:hypothetical protein Efla_003706 [Eimeria flavescens]
MSRDSSLGDGIALPSLSAADTQEDAGEAAPTTQECGFFNVATDAVEAPSINVVALSEYEKSWFPTTRLSALSNFDSEEFACESCVSHELFLLSSECPLGKDTAGDGADTAHPLAYQVAKLLATSADVAPELDRQTHKLVATIDKHASAADALADQYACAVDLVSAEARKLLAACLTRYKRLKQARQAYLCVLRHLFTCLEDAAKAISGSSQCGKLQLIRSFASNLTTLEELRAIAEGLILRRFNQEWADLQVLQEAYRQRLGIKHALKCEYLNNLLEAENNAIRLSHAARFLDLQELIATLSQHFPHQGAAAAAAIELPEKLATSSACCCSNTCCHAGTMSQKPMDGRQVQEAKSILKAIQTQKAVSRLLLLEQTLSPKLTAETRRAVQLTRLATNLKAASAHLGAFSDVLTGPKSLYTASERTPQQKGLWPCVKETASCTTGNCSHPSPSQWLTPYGERLKAASQRLVMHGVAFHGGALLRANGGFRNQRQSCMSSKSIFVKLPGICLSPSGSPPQNNYTKCPHGEKNSDSLATASLRTSCCDGTKPPVTLSKSEHALARARADYNYDGCGPPAEERGRTSLKALESPTDPLEMKRGLKKRSHSSNLEYALRQELRGSPDAQLEAEWGFVNREKGPADAASSGKTKPATRHVHPKGFLHKRSSTAASSELEYTYKIPRSRVSKRRVKLMAGRSPRRRWLFSWLSSSSSTVNALSRGLVNKCQKLLTPIQTGAPQSMLGPGTDFPCLKATSFSSAANRRCFNPSRKIRRLLEGMGKRTYAEMLRVLVQTRLMWRLAASAWLRWPFRDLKACG